MSQQIVFINSTTVIAVKDLIIQSLVFCCGIKSSNE
jgi:hypothetical protein